MSDKTTPKSRPGKANPFNQIMTRANTTPALPSDIRDGIQGAKMLTLSQLVPSSQQIRQDFDEDAIAELAADIKVRGILEPLIVREKQPGQEYEIIAGERRYRAALLANLEQVPVIVKQLDDSQARFAMLAENLQRQDLTDEDERRFFQTLQNEYNLSAKEIAGLINKSARYVQVKLYGNDKPKQGLAEEATDSEINHNNAKNSLLRKNSQTPPNVKSQEVLTSILFNPGKYKKVSQFFDTALEVVKARPDKKTMEKLEESLSQMEQKMVELRQELNRVKIEGEQSE